MNEIIFQIDEAPEGGYTAKALGHAIFTEADTLDGSEVLPGFRVPVGALFA